VDSLEQGDCIPELVIIEEHPNFGKEELNVKSGVIFRRAVPQDDLVRNKCACTFMVRVCLTRPSPETGFRIN